MATAHRQECLCHGKRRTMWRWVPSDAVVLRRFVGTGRNACATGRQRLVCPYCESGSAGAELGGDTGLAAGSVGGAALAGVALGAAASTNGAALSCGCCCGGCVRNG